MEYRLGAPHGRRQRLGTTDVPAMNRYTSLLKPGHVFAGEREHPHSVTTFEKRLDDVMPHEPVAAGDENVHVIRSSSAPRRARRGTTRRCASRPPPHQP